MSTRQPRHREVRAALARQITEGAIAPGERLPSERDLQAQFGCARSVVRQALAGLTRDGWVIPSYPRGYVVLGPRIPWISRLRALRDEPWQVTILAADRTTAPESVAAALGVPVGSAAIRRTSRLAGGTSGEPWGLGVVHYPADGLNETHAAILLSPEEITYDDLEAAFGRRIVGYHERIRARLPSDDEAAALAIPADLPLLEMARLTRTTGAPISAFRFAARSDVFEADYPIET